MPGAGVEPEQQARVAPSRKTGAVPEQQVRADVGTRTKRAWCRATGRHAPARAINI